MNFAVAALAAGAIALTASAAFAQDASQTAAATASASAADQAATGHIPPPPKGKGQVVFFRPGAYAGAAVWYKVRENAVELGKLTNQSYFVAVVDPGTHTFTASTENKTKLKLEVDDGETLYVRGAVQMGILVGEPNLTPSDQALFEKHYAHMKLAKAPDAAAAPAGGSAPAAASQP